MDITSTRASFLPNLIFLKPYLPRILWEIVFTTRNELWVNVQVAIFFATVNYEIICKCYSGLFKEVSTVYTYVIFFQRISPRRCSRTIPTIKKKEARFTMCPLKRKDSKPWSNWNWSLLSSETTDANFTETTTLVDVDIKCDHCTYEGMLRKRRHCGFKSAIFSVKSTPSH